MKKNFMNSDRRVKFMKQFPLPKKGETSDFFHKYIKERQDERYRNKVCRNDARCDPLACH